MDGGSISLEDEMGPLVVGADGSLARIANWVRTMSMWNQGHEWKPFHQLVLRLSGGFAASPQIF